MRRWGLFGGLWWATLGGLGAQEVRRPRRLLFYGTGPGANGGHAVVTFETDAGLNVIDPMRPSEVRVLPRVEREDARGLAEAVVWHRLTWTRWMPLDELLPAPANSRGAA